MRQEFENHAEFGLSEHVTCSADLPEDKVASQTWRVLILHPRDKGDLCDLLYQLEYVQFCTDTCRLLICYYNWCQFIRIVAKKMM